jgi:hypothetical protein
MKEINLAHSLNVRYIIWLLSKPTNCVIVNTCAHEYADDDTVHIFGSDNKKLKPDSGGI